MGISQIFTTTTQGIKPVVKPAWCWAGARAAWMAGEPIYLHPPPTPVPCISQEQPQGPQKLLPALVPPKQGRQDVYLGSCAPTVLPAPCGTSRKEAQPQHLPVTQNHPGKERMGTHQQLAHRAALERSHFPFAAQITCCSTSGSAAQGLPVPNTPPLAPAGTSHLVPAWIAPRADKKLQLMLLAGGKGAPAVPNNPEGEGTCQEAAGLL